MNKRLFLAIPISEHVKKGISSFKASLDSPSLHWVEEKNLHITLAFFGYVEEQVISELEEEIQSVLEKTNPFVITFKKIVILHRKGKGLLWAEFEGNKEFNQLVAKVKQAVTKYVPDLEHEKQKEQIPHITLARFKTNKLTNSLHLPPLRIENIPISSCNLLESHLTSHGPIYKTLTTFELEQKLDK